MNLTPAYKKLIAVIIIAVCIPIQLLLILMLFYKAIVEDTALADALSFLFVAGLFCFPLSYALRLWNEGKAASKAKNISIDPETNIRATAHISIKDYRKLIFILSYKRPVLLYLNFIALAMIMLSLVNDTTDYWTIFILLFVLYLPIAVYRSANSNYASTKSIHEIIQYEFTPDYINVTGATFNSTQKWSTLYKVKEMNNWFLLYNNKQTAMMIPKKTFPTAQVIDQFRDMVIKLTNHA
jgi:hypothetical protein